MKKRKEMWTIRDYDDTSCLNASILFIKYTDLSRLKIMIVKRG